MTTMVTVTSPTLPRMPVRTASTVTFFYALGYPVGNAAVAAMSPMAVLVFRFALAAAVLGTWARVAGVDWPRGAKFGHVAVTGLLMQAVQFCFLYLAIQRGAPAVLCAVVIAMNPVATALLAAVFLRDRLGALRIVALALGVAAVLAACASRLAAEHGVDPAVMLLLVALLGLAAGGVYQQRFCADVDYRAAAAVQNLVALVPAVVLAALTPFAVHNTAHAVVAVAGVVFLNAALASVALRARDQHSRRAGGRDAVLRHPGRRRGAVLGDAGSADRCRGRRRPGARRRGVLVERQGVTSAASGRSRWPPPTAGSSRCGP